MLPEEINFERGREMKRFTVLLITTALLMLTLAACGGGETKETSAPADQPAAQQQETSSSGPLADLMKNAQLATEYSFETVMTAGGDNPFSSTSKMYISGDKSRIEMDTAGTKMITIIDEAGDVYIYDPNSKTAMKTAAATAQDETTEAPNTWAEEDAANLEVTGEEKVDGVDCLVVQNTEEGIVTKMWLRKDIGLPARIEVPEQNVVMEYKNYDIGKQDPALFKLPADAVITELPTMP